MFMPLPAHVSDLAPYELLLSVARLGSLSAAARAHGVSQPAASTTVARLERRLGLALLQRSTRGSRLTGEGAMVADWARGALDAVAALDAGLASLRADHGSHLRVAASLTVAEYLMPRWLATLKAASPAIGVALTTGNSEDAATAVLDGSAQLGFIEGPTVPRGLRSRTVAHDTLVVVTAPTHPWARRHGGITADQLATTALVAREHGSGTRRYLERALADLTPNPLADPLLELGSTTAIKAAVAAGAGPAVLSTLAVAPDLSAGTLTVVRVIDLHLVRRLRFVHLGSRPLEGPAAELAAIAARHENPRRS